MILLSTLNARYIHSSLALRYLYANLAELQPRTDIQEFTINQRPIDIAEQIIAHNPRILGLGVYIWNLTQTTELIAILKRLEPGLTIVLGGPEISFETEQSPAFVYADYIIRGPADLAFTELCRQLIAGSPAQHKIINAAPIRPDQLQMPYAYYNDEDIRQRVIYVEASRGCPFKCEFCLSALDKTAQAFSTGQFLQELDSLYDRGARHFKFVDRTFNLNTRISRSILSFFLAKPLHDLHLHFEMIPDRLPDELKGLITRFPPGCLQFEIGIQTFNPSVQANISRKQDRDKTLHNLDYLRQHTGVHVHADLIAGLPGEDLHSFAQGFDLLVSKNPHEIQVGILKRLRGTPMIRHQQQFAMVFNPVPPYNILSTRDMDAATLFRLSRFTRYWDLIANSGRFSHSLPILLEHSPFGCFMALSDWLFATTGQTHRIALPRLFRLLYQYGNGDPELNAGLRRDFERSGIKGHFDRAIAEPSSNPDPSVPSAFSRQRQHLRSSPN